MRNDIYQGLTQLFSVIITTFNVKVILKTSSLVFKM